MPALLDIPALRVRLEAIADSLASAPAKAIEAAAAFGYDPVQAVRFARGVLEDECLKASIALRTVVEELT